MSGIEIPISERNGGQVRRVQQFSIVGVTIDTYARGRRSRSIVLLIFFMGCLRQMLSFRTFFGKLYSKNGFKTYHSVAEIPQNVEKTSCDSSPDLGRPSWLPSALTSVHPDRSRPTLYFSPTPAKMREARLRCHMLSCLWLG